MYAPTVELTDANNQRVGIVFVAVARALLCLGLNRRLKRGVVRKMSAMVDPHSVTIMTGAGRRLTCAGGQRVAIRGKLGKIEWRKAWKLSPGDVLFAVDDNLLTVDRISCIVQAEKPGEPWITVATDCHNIFAEEILCRAS